MTEEATVGRAPEDLRDVVAGLLADSRLLTACAERDMGTLFRLLNHRGISTRRIAGAVDIGQGRLYEYMNGKSRVEKLVVFEQIADAFHIPGHLLGLARRPWEPAAPVTPSVPGPAASVPDEDDMAAMDAFRNADRQAGGGRLYQAVVRHLTETIGPRLVDADSGPQTLAVAAALTEMAGWMAHDSGHDELAGRHFNRALPLARAAGDTPLAAGIAASNSHLALQTGDPSAAVHWARTGLDTVARGAAVPALAARLHAMSARALAAAGQPTAALRALDRAEQLLDGKAESDLAWLSPFDAAALATESALVLRDLERYDHAQASAEHAIRLRETGRARSLAFNRITLATVHVRQRDLESAIAVGHELLAADPNLGSVRVVRQLDGLSELLEPQRAHPPVRAFLARFDDARRARVLLLADVLFPPRGGITP
ncbi:XRE family transcriptional regulator [Streptomyces sp. NBC_00448]|uniref:XRE family transcriptional regulator n=1 Tax=Streptomyces sp. NBC_00448 TaxID=2903652 RepID=UPI002E1B6DA2